MGLDYEYKLSTAIRYFRHDGPVCVFGDQRWCEYQFTYMDKVSDSATGPTHLGFLYAILFYLDNSSQSITQSITRYHI